MAPLRVFAALMALIALIVAGIILLRPDTKPHGTTDPVGPAFALSDQEAIERFGELNALRLEAYARRDPSLLSLYLTTDSPLVKDGRKDIRTLRREGVIVKPNFTTKRLHVLENKPTVIIVRQTVMERPRFTDQESQDVTISPGYLRTIDWTLHQERAEWKIFDSELIRNRRLDH